MRKVYIDLDYFKVLISCIYIGKRNTQTCLIITKYIFLNDERSCWETFGPPFCKRISVNFSCVDFCYTKALTRWRNVKLASLCCISNSNWCVLCKFHQFDLISGVLHQHPLFQLTLNCLLSRQFIFLSRKLEKVSPLVQIDWSQLLHHLVGAQQQNFRKFRKTSSWKDIINFVVLQCTKSNSFFNYDASTIPLDWKVFVDLGQFSTL